MARLAEYRAYCRCSLSAKLGGMHALITWARQTFWSSIAQTFLRWASCCQVCLKLRVSSPDASFAAYSLSAFSRLTTLKMRMGRKEEYREIQMQELDMSVLPPSITVLELMGFKIDPLGSSSTKCLGIKSLTITWAGNTAEEIVALLQQFPLLQASLFCARRIELVWVEALVNAKMQASKSGVRLWVMTTSFKEQLSPSLYINEYICPQDLKVGHFLEDGNIKVEELSGFFG